MRMCCASRSAGSKTTSPAASPTASCRPRRPRATRCFRSSTRSPLPSPISSARRSCCGEADPRLLVPLLVWFGALRPADALDGAAGRPGQPGGVRCARAGDRARGRQLHQHPFGEAVRPSRPGTGLCQARRSRRRARPSAAKCASSPRWMSRCPSLNGLFIVRSSAGRWRCGMQGAATVGVVAAAAALVLRLNAMTDWIMWALTNFFRSSASCRRGWRPSPSRSTCSTSPARVPIEVTRGGIRVRRGRASLRPRVGRAGRHLDRREAGREDRAGRPLGRGQIDPGQADAAVLRRRRRPDPDRRAGHRRRSRRTACAAQIGMVQQDPRLLHRSVRDNILYGRPDATDDQMIAAARAGRGA